MAFGPLLETKRLQLIPFTEEFLTERYVSWLNDSEVVRFSELRHFHHNQESCRAYLKSFQFSPGYYWAIIEKNREIAHIGNITVNVDEPNRVADIGILLGEKQSWGAGFGLEAWSAVCRYLQTNQKIRKITAGAMESNTAMLRIATKAGMVEEARRPGHFLLDGKSEAVVYWVLDVPHGDNLPYSNSRM
jgi:ribosomal-protein-alanine N-acetyltransferase